MKAILEDIQLEKGTASFHAYLVEVPFFEFKWHYHPEYELTYIIKGNGFRILGNTYENYTNGDFVLLGSNLPHTWSGNSNQSENSQAIVIQFSHELIQSFLNFEESEHLKIMLEQAKRGIQFTSEKEITSKLKELLTAKGMDRILKLISILDVLAKKTNRIINPNTFHNILSTKNELRINKVCRYIENNYNNAIHLKQVADLIFLTESNFCKFFKKTTGKTFSDYVNEMRINEACRLLIQSEKTINQISFECGFETLSYFNRVFLKKKNSTPSNYRKKINQK